MRFSPGSFGSIPARIPVVIPGIVVGVVLVLVSAACQAQPTTTPVEGRSDDHVLLDVDAVDTSTSPDDGGPVAQDNPTDVGIGPTVAAPLLRARAQWLHDSFSADAAMVTATYLDQFFRVRGNAGYEQSLQYIRNQLVSAGFAETDLVLLPFGPERPTWTPRRASVTLSGEQILGFSSEADHGREVLLVGSNSVVRQTFELVAQDTLSSPAEAAGRVVLARGAPSGLYQVYVIGGGAAGIMTEWLDPFHRRHEDDAIAQFGYVPYSSGHSGFGFSLSAPNYARLASAVAAGPTSIDVEVEVDVGTGRATALEAIIHGGDPTLGPVVFFAHIDEPGANDNASGAAALAELAGTIHRAIYGGDLTVPRRSLIFLWGQEYESSIAWLNARAAAGEPAPIVGLVMDMVGQDPDIVGAPFLVERTPDPGAIWTRPPDAHTEWGAGYVNPAWVVGHFLNDYLIEATEAFDWNADTNPYAGGSDHEPFLERGIPAVLGWHFTDTAYHSTEDRIDRVSGNEMRRVSAALGSVALGIALAHSGDYLEMVQAVVAGRDRRTVHVLAAAREQTCPRLEDEMTIAGAWYDWYQQAVLSVGVDAVAADSSELTAVIAASQDTPAWMDELRIELEAIPSCGGK